LELRRGDGIGGGFVVVVPLEELDAISEKMKLQMNEK
jgi:hypothetical protein